MNEITPELIYWVTRLDHIRMLLGWLSVITVATSIAAYIFAVITRNRDDDICDLKHGLYCVKKFICDEKYVEKISENIGKTAESINDLKSSIKKSLRIVMFTIIAFFILFAGCSFVPNTKEACAILVIPQVANSSVVQQELPKSIESIVRIANNYLEEKLTTPSKKGGEE
jgi:signal transduction histidine kinase